MKEQDIRMEAVKAAARVSGEHDGIANLLIHAEWIETFIIRGKDAVIVDEEPIHCKASHERQEGPPL
jgi:hypothetical protein